MRFKNINIYKLFSLLVGLSLLTQCTDDFEDLNADPKNPAASTPGLLFNSVVRKIPISGNGNNALYIQNHHTYDWSQLSATDLDAEFEVEVNVRGIESVWNNYFAALRDIEAIQTSFDEINSGPNASLNVNRQAILDIVHALMTLRTTDLYGDIPYSQAGKGQDAGEQILRPAYDTQESIYRDAIRKLENASNMIVTEKKAPDGQPYFTFGIGETIFKNDMSKWQKLANTLLLRYGIRLSNVDPGETSRIASLVLDEDRPLPESDDEVLRFSNDREGIGGGAYFAWEFYFGVRMGENIWNHMTESNDPMGTGIIDPRVHIYFERNIDSLWLPMPQSPADREELTGSPYVTERKQNPAGFEHRGNYSGHNFLLVSDNDHGTDFQTSFAEICFLRAEAYQQGWASGDAKEWYERGIKASVERWYSVTTSRYYDEFGIPVPVTSEEEITALINHPKNAWNDADGLKLIHTQRWLDMFLRPNDAWYLVRRSGLIPLLETRFSQSQEVIGMPTRIVYPEDEKNNNQQNYQEAVSRYNNGDSYFSDVWWDK